MTDAGLDPRAEGDRACDPSDSNQRSQRNRVREKYQDRVVGTYRNRVAACTLGAPRRADKRAPQRLRWNATHLRRVVGVPRSPAPPLDWCLFINLCSIERGRLEFFGIILSRKLIARYLYKVHFSQCLCGPELDEHKAKVYD
jgi:hypothetical protein